MLRKYLMTGFTGLVFWSCCGSKGDKCAAGTDRNDRCQKKAGVPVMDTGLTCRLTSAELQKRKATVIARLQKLQREKKELANGFAYRFEGSDNNLDLLVDFVKSERQCCGFFDFAVRVGSNQAAWLEITGPPGAKAFIQTELGM
jgi:hypothetical protein